MNAVLLLFPLSASALSTALSASRVGSQPPLLPARLAQAARVAVPPSCDGSDTPFVSQKVLYSKIEAVIKRAKMDELRPLGARTARALSQRWLELSSGELVEATFVSGALVLRDFDEGLEILLEAEEGADVEVSAKAYYALCRLAVAEQRPLDVLALLARARGQEVERTGSLLLIGMQAAAELEDWGAVARLYAELATGPEAAAELALLYESFAEPTILEELQRSRGDSDAGSLAQTLSTWADPSNELAEAMCLALRAHCERGDVASAKLVLARMRVRGAPLGLSELEQLIRLSSRLGRPDPLLALEPADLKLTAERLLEPRLFSIANKAGELSAALGTTERAIVLSLAGGFLGAIAITALFGSLLPTPPSDPFDF